MRIVALSDVHEMWGALRLPPADLLIMAGDICERRDESFAAADSWLRTVNGQFSRVIYVPGNHDQPILEQPQKYSTLAPILLGSMLVDRTIEFEGFRIHGMPWDFGDRESPESLIPEGVDILVTHEPPEGILDWSPRAKDDRLGNRELLKRVREVRPRLHIFGHCHMAFGVERRYATTFVNVAICGRPDKYYAAAHPPTTIVIDSTSVALTQAL